MGSAYSCRHWRVVYLVFVSIKHVHNNCLLIEL